MRVFSADLLILLTLPLFAIAGRKLSDNKCQCGVKVVRDNVTVSPWLLYVHNTISPTQIATCIGIVLASNTILTSRQCLQGPEKLPKDKDLEALPIVLKPIMNVSITNSKQAGQGTSYPVLNVTDQTNVSFVVIQVGADFSLRASKNKPVCLPSRDEPNEIISTGANVTYVSAKTGAIHNLVVRKGEDCNSRGKAENGAGELEKDVLCVTFINGTVELEVGQPIFIEIGRNPHRLYPTGFYTYLAGVSSFILERKDGKKHLFFTPINTLVDAVESLANSSGATWCSQPWPWLNAPEKIKRDKSLDCECGMSQEPIIRLVGGEDAGPYEFPWMVMISRTFPQAGKTISLERFCGGTIINDRMILTATHCIINFGLLRDQSVGYDTTTGNQTFTIHLHAHLRSGDSEEIEAEVIGEFMHPGFIDGMRTVSTKGDNLAPSADHDIALLMLKTPLNFSATDKDNEFLYRPACLPNWGEKIDVVGRNGIALGWGFNASDQAIFPEALQKSTWRLESVDKSFKELNISVPKDKYSLLCAMEDDTYAMHGDSGGPVLVKDKMGKHTQIGILNCIQVATRNGERFQVNFMANLQVLLPFVEYYSDQVGAKYCKK